MSTNCSNLIKTPLLPVTTMMSSTHNHNHTPQKQTQPQQHPITTTKMGSRRIFSAQFKLQVLDSYRMDSDCKGNQRATARKYGIHRRQIQKWLQNESNLRSSVNNNNELQNHNKSIAVQPMNSGATISNSRTANNLSLSSVDNVIVNKRLLHQNASAANKSINQSAMSGNQPTTYNFTKNLSPNAIRQMQNHPQRHSACETNTLSLDITRHSVATNIRNYHEPTIELNFNTANEYKCASNATPSTNTSFSVSVASCSSSLAPSSFVARPVPHSMTEPSISYSTQRQPLRIVSPSYLMPSNASHAMNGVSLIPNHPNNHSTYQPQPFELNPLMYEPSTSMNIIGSIRHCLSTPHEYSVAVPPFASRAMPSAFHFPQQNGFFENPSATPYDLYRTPTYLPPIAIPTPLVSGHTQMENNETESLEELQKIQSPIDLSLPGRQSPAARESNQAVKPRFSLPSPPVKMIFNTMDIPNSDGNDVETNIHKPWDLSCSRKRKFEDDIDEGISVNHEQTSSSDSNAKSVSSPTPAKIVKLFKPYLLSNGEENEQNGKKCSTSDHQQKDPIIWSSHPFYKNTNSATMAPFRSPVSTSTEHQQSNSIVPSSTYWLNHGSPVSGYDSASSTFSDCNCNDSSCQTKLASPAPTVASFSDEFTSSPACGPSTENHPETTQSTKYMIPRRHILEKWSHEDDELSHQFNSTQQELIAIR